MMKLGMGLFLGCLLAQSTYAQTDVRLTNTELNAAFTLIRPSTNVLELNDKTGVFTPGPTLKFLGIPTETFAIDLSSLKILGVSFNHLKSKSISVKFDNKSIWVSVDIEDQQKAIYSRLGSISLSGASLHGSANWMTRANGTQYLAMTATTFEGGMSGTGVLASGAILKLTKKILMKQLEKLFENLLQKDEIQQKIQDGLVYWAKFYVGQDFRAITPGSLRFYAEDEESGLDYKAQ